MDTKALIRGSVLDYWHLKRKKPKIMSIRELLENNRRTCRSILNRSRGYTIVLAILPDTLPDSK
jgi:hypothetical protein